ncbi:uncharacterized membrane protein YoaK (UPF0700 family) [Rhizobium sp. BK619]|uniref:Putative membrane protein n=1 Tax=Rhizobium leguminosarum bv. trifolii WSM597 TaxID=754764 RepID=I9NDJ7_RHILT|nr:MULTISPECIES: YoaK family protein [Rhizobium]EJB05979.1 putative membrane protein [Rhizobium leguminosarum bv. trifolii WSM597]MBB3648299.1 uncharacterized membrane protein YoaK (UPF0700 family) [Rhizobium sp. BK619]
MLIKEGESRTLRKDILLASSLAFVAGGVNSAGYLGFGYFSANMTGNVSLISDHVSAGDLYLAAAFLGIVAMFVAGAFTAALFIQIGKRRRLTAIYALTLLAEAALLMGVGLYALRAGPSVSGIGTVGAISFAMGIQNAASTRISGSRVRTTHVSGIATDIGVGLAQVLEPSDAHAGRHTRDRLLLHSATVGSFLVGGTIGVLCYHVAGGAVFCAFSIVLLLVCVRYLVGVSDR